jgi:hypothetical protein
VEHVSRFLAACAAIALMAAAPLDSAVIDGTRGTLEYQIVVNSDGTASLSSNMSDSKPFRLPEEIVTSFFAALEASYRDNWTSGPCEKKAPFDGTISVTWHEWVSADVTCPANEPNAQRDWVRLNHAVNEIVVLAGPPAAIPCYELPDWPPNCTPP